MTNTKYLIEKTLESKQVFSGNFMQVYSDKVQLPDNKAATREYIKHSGATCIIAITSDNKVVMEYQYRYPVGSVMLELPAGKLEIDEEPINCAKRELAEETGYIAKQWVELGNCLPCIAYSTEKITYYLATELTQGTIHPDDGEFLETTLIPMNKLIQMAYDGKIKDSKTMSGIMLYLGYIQKNK